MFVGGFGLGIRGEQIIAPAVLLKSPSNLNPLTLPVTWLASMFQRVPAIGQ